MDRKRGGKLRSRWILCVLLLVLLLTGVYGCNLFRQAGGDSAIDTLQALKPAVPEEAVQEDEAATDKAAQEPMNFTSLCAQAPGVSAWLTVPGTVIDYPVLQAADNAYYLTHDAAGNPNKNGALFLDYRVHSDFSDFNSVVYGHHMKSGRMFQNLMRFKNKAFFEEHPTAVLYTPEQTYQLEIFALALTTPNSAFYDYALLSPAQKTAHLQMIRDKAMHYRDIGVSENDRIVLLSTCSYEYKDARTVLAARLSLS